MDVHLRRGGLQSGAHAEPSASCSLKLENAPGHLPRYLTEPRNQPQNNDPDKPIKPPGWFFRTLLGECVPARLRRAFPGHAVKTVTECGWRSGKDFGLLEFAEETFDVFVTVDRRLPRENDLSRYRLGFVIVNVLNNRLEAFEPIFVDLNQAAEGVKPGEVIFVGKPK